MTVRVLQDDMELAQVEEPAVEVVESDLSGIHSDGDLDTSSASDEDAEGGEAFRDPDAISDAAKLAYLLEHKGQGWLDDVYRKLQGGVDTVSESSADESGSVSWRTLGVFRLQLVLFQVSCFEPSRGVVKAAGALRPVVRGVASATSEAEASRARTRREAAAAKAAAELQAEKSSKKTSETANAQVGSVSTSASAGAPSASDSQVSAEAGAEVSVAPQDAQRLGAGPVISRQEIAAVAAGAPSAAGGDEEAAVAAPVVAASVASVETSAGAAGGGETSATKDAGRPPVVTLEARRNESEDEPVVRRKRPFTTGWSISSPKAGSKNAGRLQLKISKKKKKRSEPEVFSVSTSSAESVQEVPPPLTPARRPARVEVQARSEATETPKRKERDAERSPVVTGPDNPMMVTPKWRPATRLPASAQCVEMSKMGYLSLVLRGKVPFPDPEPIVQIVSEDAERLLATLNEAGKKLFRVKEKAGKIEVFRKLPRPLVKTPAPKTLGASK